VLRNAVDANRAAVGASMYERAEGYNPSNGRDNFTSRTASGVAAVLANSGGGNSDSSSSGIIADNAGLTELPYAPPEASSNLDSWLMAGLVGLLAFVVWEWVTD
jgi:hypothetical protein